MDSLEDRVTFDLAYMESIMLRSDCAVGIEKSNEVPPPVPPKTAPMSYGVGRPRTSVKANAEISLSSAVTMVWFSLTAMVFVLFVLMF